MSELGTTLATKNREFALKCKITIAVDSDLTTTPATYSILLDAPEQSETLITGATSGEVASALTEFTDWVTALW